MDLPQGAVLLDQNFGTTVVNATDIPNADVFHAVEQQNRELFATFERWAEDVSGSRLNAYSTYQPGAPYGGGFPGKDHRAGNLWHRDRYLSPTTPFDQMRLARAAVVDDDLVSGVADASEALTLDGMSFFAADPDEQDVYNQIARKIDLDSRMREIWRELYTVSQVYVACTWGEQTFKVRGTTKDGNQRRKEFKVVAPKQVVVLDPTKVIPVGNPYANAFQGTDSFAYMATRDENLAFTQVIDETITYDDIVSEIVVKRYEPVPQEAAELASLGVDVSHLWLLDPNKVFRHTLSRPGYRRLADVRMKSIFELLDMKHQLRQMERAHLIGGTNFVVLIKKGTDQHPALPVEIANLQAQARTVSRVPILVGDHRLSVEIITPKLDNTLRAERWNTLDARVTARLWGMFMLGLYCLSADTEILTAEGWKTHDRLGAGDVVLTLDPRTNTSVWEQCSAVNRFECDQELTSIEGRGISALATGNHRWWVRRKLGNGKPGYTWEFRTTDQLNDWCSIPLAVPHAGFPTVPKYSDALVELIAWYWTEGHDKNESAGVEIGQSEAVNPQHCARIRAALTAELGTTGWSTWLYRGRHRTFGIHAPFGRLLRSLAPDRVPSPEFLCNLTEAQLVLFIERSLDADGHVEPGGKRSLVQKDERRMKAFEMACALAGIPTNTNLHTIYQIVLKSKSFVHPHRASRLPGAVSAVTQQHYKGIVWCPTTPNGTWLARRNGTIYWTGNSAGAAGDDSVKLVKVIARNLEARRHMIRRSLERNIFSPLYENNDALTTQPKLQFHPRSVALDFDAPYATFLFDLWQSRGISRETILNQFDLDQDLEAEYLKREADLYDDIFKTQVPFSTPNPANVGQPALAPQAQPGQPTTRDNGGGRRNGGGAAPGTGQGQPPRRATRKQPAAAGAPRLTIGLEGADGITREDLLTALRAALAEGDDDADAAT